MSNTNWSPPDPDAIDAEIRRLIDEVAESDSRHQAAERIAEHTGDQSFLVADKVANALCRKGRTLTSGDRLLIASIIGEHYNR